MTDSALRLPFFTTPVILALTFSLYPKRCMSQDIDAKAISYTASLDLATFDPVYYEMTDADTTDVYFEVDMYYTPCIVKTVHRIQVKPSDFDVNFAEAVYDPAGTDEIFVNEGLKKVSHIPRVESRAMKLKARKKILGHQCRAYLVRDFKGNKVVAFVAGDLQKNISPIGNLNLPGTALELITADGFHYMATEFSQGELSPSFFSLPTDYQTEIISAAAGD